MPIVRDDLRIGQSYRPAGEPPLPCPLHVFGGRDDPLAPPETLAAWSTSFGAAAAGPPVRRRPLMFREPDPELVAAVARIVEDVALEEDLIHERLHPRVFASAASSPHGLTVGTVADPVRMTWRDVHEQAKRMAGCLAAKGVGRHGSVAVLASEAADVAPLAQAIWLSGAALTMLQHRLLEPTWRSGSTTPCGRSGWSMPTWSSSGTPS